MIKLFKKNILFRFAIYLAIILAFIYLNLSTYDLYIISRNPLIFFRSNWFEIITIVLLFAIYYKVSSKK